MFIEAPELASYPNIRHAFFTRQGGISGGLYSSLNLGLGSKDDPTAVAENRRRCAAHLGGELVTAYQVHSATALVAADQMGEIFKAACIHSPGWVPPPFEDDR